MMKSLDKSLVVLSSIQSNDHLEQSPRKDSPKGQSTRFESSRFRSGSKSEVIDLLGCQIEDSSNLSDQLLRMTANNLNGEDSSEIETMILV